MNTRTSGQRILPKGRIAPALVTPATGESPTKSILKLHFCHYVLSVTNRSAAL